ncbi:MAG: hypothetical protein CMC15_13605 [Flavobacteriaceae bacterium]|nr:hypothetical protein [Flavobacteriaceae bacterium]
MKTRQEKDRIAKARQVHHDALEKLALIINPLHPITGKDRHESTQKTGLQLWRQLKRIENKAHKAATDYCNGKISCDQMQIAENHATQAVEKVFGRLPQGFFVNYDPRGYALKLEPFQHENLKGKTLLAYPNLRLEKDWGNNQILAPEVD